MEKIVDAMGLACPLPVVNAKSAADEMDEGTLKVLVDNEVAVQNLTKFANGRGYSVTNQKIDEAKFEVTMEVVPVEAKDEVITCNVESPNKGIVVVISSDKMGEGEEKLGKSLMKAFIFALTKQDVLPETILCYNKGAFMTCEGSDALEDLKAMEAEGVNIATCGTCLDFYGIKEKLVVGSVTNMYDIVEKQEKAVKIIRP